jgi:hypothetical protein
MARGQRQFLRRAGLEFHAGAQLAVDLHDQRHAESLAGRLVRRRPGRPVQRPSPPSSVQSSSQMCGVIGASMRTMASQASRTTARDCGSSRSNFAACC